MSEAPATRTPVEASPVGPRHAPAPVSGERVSVLSGDRPCIRCGFNLTGQYVVREPHYQMLVVICPECGTPASLQEYPLLGKAAARWGAVLTAWWVLFILVLLAASVGTTFGFCALATEVSGHTFAQFIAERHHEWAKLDPAARVPPASTASAQYLTQIVTQPPNIYMGIDQVWWDAQPPGALMAQAGGWWKNFDWEVVYVWLGASVPLFAAGVVWSVALSHVRRSRLWLVVPLILALAAAIGLMVWSADRPSRRWGGSWKLAAEYAQEYYTAPIFGMTVGALTLPLLGGLWTGRPLARTAIRLLLPPQRRPALSFLWMCDAKPLPFGARPERRGAISSRP